MEALDLLLNRSSQPRLQAPAPEGEALNNILQAAVQVPDHRCLSPWRFVVSTGDGLQRVADIYEKAAIAKGADESALERARNHPFRAPMIITAICAHQAHDKVPRVEQIASTACSIHSMQMAALAQGFQGMWRTGSYATDPIVKAEFECKEDDEIVGFLYVGTSPLKPMKRPEKDYSAHVSYWN